MRQMGRRRNRFSIYPVSWCRYENNHVGHSYLLLVHVCAPNYGHEGCTQLITMLIFTWKVNAEPRLYSRDGSHTYLILLRRLPVYFAWKQNTTKQTTSLTTVVCLFIVAIQIASAFVCIFIGPSMYTCCRVHFKARQRPNLTSRFVLLCFPRQSWILLNIPKRPSRVSFGWWPCLPPSNARILNKS